MIGLMSSAPSANHPQTLGLVLAGGLARRMGGGDKALITIGGTAILDRVIARLRPATTALILNSSFSSSWISTGVALP